MNEGILKRLFAKENRFIVIVFAVAVSFLIILIFLNSRPKYDSTAGGEYVDENTPGFIEYNKMPYIPTADNVVNTQVLEDIAFYARNYLEPYSKNKKESVLFVVNKEPNKTSEKVSMEGKFEKNKTKFQISLSMLKNSRVNVTIENMDSKDKKSAELPSSSTRNKLIASLPINGSKFAIDYLKESDNFYILVATNESADIDAATNELAKRLGVETLKGEKYTISFAGGPSGRSIAD